MCKGSVKVKSDLFFDLVVGPEGIKQNKETIAWKSGRMSLAIKRLVFFSEIFPKKYQNEFLQELFPKKSITVIEDGVDSDEVDTKDQLLWSDTYLILAEQKFDEIFSEVYEEKFIDHIFEKNESLITKIDFKSAIAGDMDEKAKCPWLFSPSAIREIF
jgi:hypothetical protein